MNGLFTILDNDWQHLLHQRNTRRRYRRWQAEHPVFAAHTTLPALMTSASRQGHAAEADRILAALATRADADDLAARALLQAILPGLRTLATAHYWLAPADDLEASLIAIAWQHIRCYPIATRPRRIAANLLLDTGHHLRQDRGRGPATVPIDTLARERSTPTRQPAEELTQLVLGAVADGKLRPEPAALILRTRVLDQPITEVAERLGYSPDTIRHRRRRAELTLKATA